MTQAIDPGCLNGKRIKTARYCPQPLCGYEPAQLYLEFTDGSLARIAAREVHYDQYSSSPALGMSLDES